MHICNYIRIRTNVKIISIFLTLFASKSYIKVINVMQKILFTIFISHERNKNGQINKVRILYWKYDTIIFRNQMHFAILL